MCLKDEHPHTHTHTKRNHMASLFLKNVVRHGSVRLQQCKACVDDYEISKQTGGSERKSGDEVAPVL